LSSSVDALSIITHHSLHDALPIYRAELITHEQGRARILRPLPSLDRRQVGRTDRLDPLLRDLLRRHTQHPLQRGLPAGARGKAEDRKSTRLNSSHVKISYAVFSMK